MSVVDDDDDEARREHVRDIAVRIGNAAAGEDVFEAQTALLIVVSAAFRSIEDRRRRLRKAREWCAELVRLLGER